MKHTCACDPIVAQNMHVTKLNDEKEFDCLSWNGNWYQSLDPSINQTQHLNSS